MGKRRIELATILAVLVLMVTILQVPLLREAVNLSSPHQLEIQLTPSAIWKEGMGAVAQGLKPVLLLANATGAVITAPNKDSGHGYRLSTYFRFRRTFYRYRTVCPASRNVSRVFQDIMEQCEQYPYHELASLFAGCNTIVVTKWLDHPRRCVQHAAGLVRAFTKFPTTDGPKRDVCVLRRGGDVERMIESGQYNQWAMDTRRLFPILEVLKKRGARLVVVTETGRERTVRQQYHADLLSNKEKLESVVIRLSSCRCLFLSSCSSFAVTMMQIAQPSHVVYTANHSGFQFPTVPYAYKEWGERAHSMLEDPSKLAAICAPS